MKGYTHVNHTKEVRIRYFNNGVANNSFKITVITLEVKNSILKPLSEHN